MGYDRDSPSCRQEPLAAVAYRREGGRRGQGLRGAEVRGRVELFTSCRVKPPGVGINLEKETPKKEEWVEVSGRERHACACRRVPCMTF